MLHLRNATGRRSDKVTVDFRRMPALDITNDIDSRCSSTLGETGIKNE